MRHRITFIGRPGSNLRPEQITVTNSSLTVDKLDAAKEHRVTLGLAELPRELRQMVAQSQELHIRWRSFRPYSQFGPHVSSMSPGLHVFQTPKEGSKGAEETTNTICSNLSHLFGKEVKCESRGFQAFTLPPVGSTRFARSSSRQLYSYIDRLDHLSEYTANQWCPTRHSDCSGLVSSSNYVQSLDLDYDYISQAAVITAYWDECPYNDGLWDEGISKANLHSDNIEVGVLSQESTKSHEEIRLAGSLTVIGEHTRPKGTAFSFPSRHHIIPKASFQSSFDRPTGLHPMLRLSISIPGSDVPTKFNPTCRLHTYLTLPSTLFIDRYAFADDLFLASHHLGALHSVSGATDLETPDWTVPQWGSASLFELQMLNTDTRPSFDVTIPLHTRYSSPSAGGYANASLPYPVVFYACKALDEDSPPLSTNPFDRTNLGYDGLFGERTIFYHMSPELTPASSKLSLHVTVPVLDMNKTAYIESSTVVAILLGCLWLVWKLFAPFSHTHSHVDKKTK